MELSLSKLAIDETSDQLLVIYHPDEAHPESADLLTLLTSLAVSPQPASKEMATRLLTDPSQSRSTGQARRPATSSPASRRAS